MILIATQSDILRVEPENGSTEVSTGLDADRPTCLAVEREGGTAWCGTRRGGVFSSDDEGSSWRPAGLEGRHVTALACDLGDPSVLWAGTEPSGIWTSGDGGRSWRECRALLGLPSKAEWSFPPRPDTHHVRWIASRPGTAGRLWVAVEAGALVETRDGGATWNDRVSGGPYDTHELAIHPDLPDVLRVSAGDGYYESPDGGATWLRPRSGLEVGYMRSVAIDPGDPELIVASASSGPRTAYVAGKSDGRVYRRDARQGSRWERVEEGWPANPATIAPLLVSGESSGELWAADERGLHRSENGGRDWERVASLPSPPDHLRGLALL